MTNYLPSFIHLIFIGFIALFPVVNPIGSAFMVNPYFTDLSIPARRKLVKQVVFYAFSLCVVTLLLGHWILELFGISVPIIQLAGGIMICKIGWTFLSSDKQEVSAPSSPDRSDDAKLKHIENQLFYPITFPMTTGAGTIAVLFTLSAHVEAKDISQYLINDAALCLSIIGICILIYLFYMNANRLIHYMGSRNEKIVNHLMAFLIFSVGLQIAISGIFHLIKTNI